MSAPRPVVVVDPHLSDVLPVASVIRLYLASLAEEREVVAVTEGVEPPVAGVRCLAAPRFPRPQVLSFLSFRVTAGRRLRRLRAELADRDPIVHVTEGAVRDADVSFAQFCHRSYLRGPWRTSRPDGVRRLVRWSDHKVRAWAEARTFVRARVIIVPSSGVGAEIAAEYPAVADRIREIPNPVDLDSLARPPASGSPAGSLRLCFVALGHFERKGLPLILEAMTGERSVSLDVVGGEPDLVAHYQREVERLGLADRVTLHGLATDVRSFLWAADALAMPTAYEGFSLALLQAAAASLPLVVTRVSGVDELVRDGAGVVEVDRTVSSVRAALARLVMMTPAERAALGEASRRAVERYRPERVIEQWEAMFRDLDRGVPDPRAR